MQAALAVAAESAVLEAEKASSEVRRVPASNFHLTLALLGAIPLIRLPEVEEVAGRCARTSGAIEIVLDAIEHWRKPQVVCATASETPPAASGLAEELKQSLVEQGFSPDLKPFRVHATVARKVRRVTSELRVEPVRWSFDSLHLIESKTSLDGSTYSALKKWVLDKRD